MQLAESELAQSDALIAAAAADAETSSARPAFAAGTAVDDPAAVEEAAPEPLKHLRRRTFEHAGTRRCVEEGGEVPVHFVTLTTAIYYWADLARLLRAYEEEPARRAAAGAETHWSRARIGCPRRSAGCSSMSVSSRGTAR